MPIMRSQQAAERGTFKPGKPDCQGHERKRHALRLPTAGGSTRPRTAPGPRAHSWMTRTTVPIPTSRPPPASRPCVERQRTWAVPPASTLSTVPTGGTNDAGHFTARATLNANFNDDTITGTIDQFMGADGQSRNWSVELKESVIADGGAISGSAPSGPPAAR